MRSHFRSTGLASNFLDHRTILWVSDKLCIALIFTKAPQIINIAMNFINRILLTLFFMIAIYILGHQNNIFLHFLLQYLNPFMIFVFFTLTHSFNKFIIPFPVQVILIFKKFFCCNLLTV